MKDIVLINNFCRDFSENDNGRFMYLCKELSKDNKAREASISFEYVIQHEYVGEFDSFFIQTLLLTTNLEIEPY